MMKKLLNWFRLGNLETDLDRELKYHLDRRVSDLVRSGLPEPEARRQAALELGGVSQVQEEIRDVWLNRWLRLDTKPYQAVKIEPAAANAVRVLDRYPLDKAAIVAVWLGEKAFDKHKEYLPKFQMSLKLEKTSLATFDGETSGPNNWAVNSDVHLTVVLVNKGKVTKSFAFTSVNETDVKAVLEELKKAVKE